MVGMKSQALVAPEKVQSPNSVTISLESLASCPEQLVEIKGSHTHLKGYGHLSECKCYRFYDRTNTKHDQLRKGTVKIPYGFKTPLDYMLTNLHS